MCGAIGTNGSPTLDCEVCLLRNQVRALSNELSRIREGVKGLPVYYYRDEERDFVWKQDINNLLEKEG